MKKFKDTRDNVRKEERREKRRKTLWAAYQLGGGEHSPREPARNNDRNVVKKEY